MDLEGVKRKLTEGYERINQMKHATSKIEACRISAKSKGERAVKEAQAVVGGIVERLLNLQQSMEAKIHSTVAEREHRLDAKKKEIHDGYARLVKVCVDADKVLRGMNVDPLERSCQRLFSRFEAANIKLDAAEKLNALGLVGFEFQDNSRRFLNRNCVARLQHFDRHGQIAEQDEFWLDYQDSNESPLEEEHEISFMSTGSGHLDRSNNQAVTMRRSPTPSRSSSYSPKHCLETIKEVPETTASPMRGERCNPSMPVVHIREQELCPATFQMHNFSASAMCPPRSMAVPPPPGFSRLTESSLELRNDIRQYAYLQRKLGLAVDPMWDLNPNQHVCDATSQWASSYSGGALGNVPRSTAMFANGHAHESFCAPHKPAGSYSPLPQALDVSSEIRGLTRDKEDDDDDFVWMSDDSMDFQDPGSCSLHSKAEMNRHAEAPSRNGKTNPISSWTEAQTIHARSESNKNQVNPAHSSTASSAFRGQHCEGEIFPALDVNSHHGAQEFDKHSSKPTQRDTRPKDMAVRHIKTEKTDKPGNIKQEKDGQPEENETEPDLDCAETAKEQRRESLKTPSPVKTAEVSHPEVKQETSPVKKAKEAVEEAPAKSPEVPRPVKTKRLDLSHMLVYVGEGLFVIRAKCIEKIRGDFDHPIGVCTNSKGEVLVADTGNHIIKVCNNGRVVNKFGGDLKMRRPSAVVVNDKDEIFVKDDISLYHFDSQGQLIQTMGRRMMNSPYGLGLTREGKLVVVDALYSNGRMHVFQQDGAVETFSYHPLRNQHEDSKCRFLAVHGQDVMTSDLGRSCLYLTNQQGELIKTIGRRGNRLGELHEPAGVAVDSVGHWVVADSKNHRVQVFAPNGYFMGQVHFTGESIRRPSGIHLTTDGLLYVINYLDSVIKVFKLGVA